jgi:hypothetical protein
MYRIAIEASIDRPGSSNVRNGHDTHRFGRQGEFRDALDPPYNIRFLLLTTETRVQF